MLLYDRVVEIRLMTLGRFIYHSQVVHRIGSLLDNAVSLLLDGALIGQLRHGLLDIDSRGCAVPSAGMIMSFQSRSMHASFGRSRVLHSLRRGRSARRV